MADFSRESMLDMFIYEMNQLVEQLEQLIIQGEQGYSMDDINEIFRIMHTIKGSAAMMLYDNVSKTAHSAEDLFFFLREENPQDVDYSTLTDLVLECVDFIKNELAKIEAGEESDGNPTDIITRVKAFLSLLKGEEQAPAASEAPKKESESAPKAEEKSQKTEAESSDFPLGHADYTAKIFFEDDCEMESVRAFTLLQNLKDYISDVTTIPEDVVADGSEEIIKKDGFSFSFNSDKTYEELCELIEQTVYLKSYELLSGELKSYKAVLFFEEGCEMENVRAYTVIHNLQEYCTNIKHEPEDVIDEAATEVIRKNGFKFSFSTNKSYDDVSKELYNTVFLKALDIEEITEDASSEEKKEEPKEEKTEDKKESPKTSEPEIAPKEEAKPAPAAQKKAPASSAPAAPAAQKKAAPTQHMISVNIGKLDQLLNLMGELVIAEAMTTQNPDLEGLELESFNKSARQLRKIINDVQDTVMSMRMVSLSTTFFKMNRIVRDMCKNLGKDVQLEVVGEETEVDKNIIEHLSDPLMHIIRNSVDHGIEMPDERKAVGKPEKGTVLLEARNAGGEVVIIVKDDGQGLDTQKIFNKAKENGLLKKPENEYTEREIHQFIFHPGLSTNDQVTSYSGRGVGMDVVMNNIETVDRKSVV